MLLVTYYAFNYAGIIGQGLAPNGYVAHWCVIGHCVGIMAAHGVSLAVVFAISHPSPSHPATHPTHPPYYQY